MNVLSASLILNIAFVLFFIGKRIYFANSYKWGLKKQEKLKETRHLPIDELSIVFVGDSLTEGFPTEELFPSPHIRNLGVRGDTSKDILERISGIALAKPKKIFLNAGINDILRSVPVDTLFINYKSILKTIKSNSPNTIIYVQSLLPVGNPHEKSLPLILAFNKTLKDFCEQNSIIFINIFPPFLLDKYYSPDGLHLNRGAYEVWRSAISRYVFS
jgi:lysophospholipase L1-like esterase